MAEQIPETTTTAENQPLLDDRNIYTYTGQICGLGAAELTLVADDGNMYYDC